MATVKANFNLHSYAQLGQSPDEYYRVPTPTVDTINVTGDSVGVSPVVFKQHFLPIKEKE